MKSQKPTVSTAPEPGGLATITGSLESQSVFSQDVALVGRPPSSEQGHTDTHGQHKLFPMGFLKIGGEHRVGCVGEEVAPERS